MLNLDSQKEHQNILNHFQTMLLQHFQNILEIFSKTFTISVKRLQNILHNISITFINISKTS